jgi:hypothetical protein
MKTQLLSFLIIALSTASSALATIVYNNTATPTPAFYLYSVGSPIGPSYVTPLSNGALEELNVTFTDLNILVPNNLSSKSQRL